MFLVTLNVFAADEVQLDQFYQGDGCGVTFEKVEGALPFSSKVVAVIHAPAPSGVESIKFNFSAMKRDLKNKGFFKKSFGKPDSAWGYSYVEVTALEVEGQKLLKVEAGYESSNIIIGGGQHGTCVI